MNKIERWLRAMLEKVQGKTLTQHDILDLSDRLEKLQKRLGFRTLSDIWISSRNEEADVPVMIAGKTLTIHVCLVPIPWKFETFGR